MAADASRNVLFDFGYVLTGPQDVSAFDPILAELRLGRVAFLEAWGRHRAAFDGGELDARAYWARVLSEAGAADVEPWLDGNLERIGSIDLSAWARPRERMHALVGRLLDAEIPVGILSNMPALAGPKWMAFWPALDRIPRKLWSGDEGLAKPDPAIYRLFLERYGWRAEDTLFVDDARRNVEAAAALGFSTHLFEDEGAAVAAVEAWVAPAP
ncbi:MAG: HAD family phosphatase [Spirochaetales bacterium]|nr:HAD family phosphatase [Spirochaetales bacterium]